MTELAVAATWDTEQAWPNFAQTADLLGVDRSTLTKQARAGRFRFVTRGIGRGERLVPTTEVIRLALAYRRVPVEDTLRRLARQIALRAPIIEEARVLDELHRLPVFTCARTVGLLEGMARPRPEDAMAEGPGAPRSLASADQGRVVPLGRLRPRAMREDELPTEGLSEALDARRPREPQAHILARKPRVVRLGRLRPGARF